VFSGIVEELGSVRELRRQGDLFQLVIGCGKVREGLTIDESVAVNGTCLTVVELGDDRFSVDIAPETTRLSNVGVVKAGDRVNLERSVTLATRLGGHLVQGHVDGMAILTSRTREGNSEIVSFALPPDLARYVVLKGFIAVDGVSLTTTAVTEDSFSVSLIPHTAKLTTLGLRMPGDRVNIEVDLIGKYVERLLRGDRAEPVL
jgi:riboflavin synthase